MDNPLLAVLIHERPDPFQALKGALCDLSMETYYAQGCRQAEDLIAQYHPVLVFVDLPIWRKSHAHLVLKAISTEQTFNIIVVGTLPDIEQYMFAVERGAFNYVAPPFSHESLTQVVHSAAMDARERRESMERVLLNLCGKAV